MDADAAFDKQGNDGNLEINRPQIPMHVGSRVALRCPGVGTSLSVVALSPCHPFGQGGALQVLRRVL